MIAVSPRELKLFFDGPTKGLARLQRFIPNLHYFDTDSGTSEWEKAVRHQKPSVLLSAWTTPAIPDDVDSIKYVCHICGSIQKLVSRRQIERGVAVTNWGQSISETVAEFALMLVLSALRRSHFYADQMHVQRGWTYFPAGTQSLFDRKVGIHGFGAIARRLVPLLRPFRVSISAYSDGVPDAHFDDAGVIKCASLDELFSKSDVVVEVEALTPQTRGAVTERLLRLMPIGSSFINVGRGGVVDEKAVIQIAAEGRVRFALDVYEREPLDHASPLRSMPEVTLFPHIGGPSDDRSYLCGDFALQNLERYFSGQPLEATVTLEIYDRST